MSKIDRMTGADFQALHAKNLKAATDEIRKGVDAVTVSPGQQAAAAKDVYVAKMTSAEVQDRWAKNVSKVNLDDWKNKIKNKGIGRISAGLDEAATKIQDFGDKLIAFQKSALPAFNSRRPLTVDDAAQKAADWIKKMGEFKYKK
jgi:hypothetical protein